MEVGAGKGEKKAESQQTGQKAWKAWKAVLKDHRAADGYREKARELMMAVLEGERKKEEDHWVRKAAEAAAAGSSLRNQPRQNRCFRPRQPPTSRPFQATQKVRAHSSPLPPTSRPRLQELRLRREASRRERRTPPRRQKSGPLGRRPPNAAN